MRGEKIDGNVGTGKTLKSGPNDNVFVYFTDHGAKVIITKTFSHLDMIYCYQGLVAFGENLLKATELNKAIKDMYDAKKYKKMVFYVEACESGSMFKVSCNHEKLRDTHLIL